MGERTVMVAKERWVAAGHLEQRTKLVLHILARFLTVDQLK